MNQVIKKRIEDINNGIVPEGYKQTPFGIFPCDWETNKIINDVALCFDGSHETPIYTKEGIPFVSVENIKNIYATNKYISEKDFNEKYKNYPLKNDILMTRIGDIGTPAIVAQDIPIAYYVSLALIRPKNIVSKYLYCAIQGNVVQKSLFEKTLHIAFPKKINLEDIGKCRIVLPKDKKEQYKIAEILMKWDEMIELQEQYIQKLELRKKSIMKKLLTPKAEWKSVKLGDMAEMHAGGTPSTKNLEYWGGDIPWIQSGLIQNNYIGIKDIDGRITEKGLKNSSTAWIEKDSVLVAITGATCANIAYLKCKATANQSVISITTNKINSCFLYFYMQNARNELLALQNGSAQGGLTLKYLQNFEIQYPENQKQEKISRILSMLDEEISLQKEKLANIKEQRKAMQQYLLTGIVRVVKRHL